MLTPLQGGIRIGTAERERAASALGEHFAAGRLDTDEYDERVKRVYLAKTDTDLAPLFADLPGRPARGRQRTRPRVPFAPLIIALLILSAVAWVAVLHIPPFFLLLLVWIGFARGHRFRHRHA